MGSGIIKAAERAVAPGTAGEGAQNKAYFMTTNLCYFGCQLV